MDDPLSKCQNLFKILFISNLWVSQLDFKTPDRGRFFGISLFSKYAWA